MLDIQWNLCNPTPEFSDILWHLTTIYGLSSSVNIDKIEYSDILYNPTHFPGPLVCRIRQVPRYHYTQQTQIMKIRHQPYYKQLEEKTNRTSFAYLAKKQQIKIFRVLGLVRQRIEPVSFPRSYRFIHIQTNNNIIQPKLSDSEFGNFVITLIKLMSVNI